MIDPARSIALVFVVCLACSEPPAAVTQPAPEVPAGHVRVAGVVLKWLQGDRVRNLERLDASIRAAAANGAQVVVTTESALDGYAIASEERSRALLDGLAEEVPDGANARRLAQLADTLDIVLVVGLLERSGGRTFNSAALFGPDGEWLGSYHKRKLDYEAELNTAGDAAPVFTTPFGKLGVLVCADRRVPKYALDLAAGKPDFLVCPSGGFFGAKNDRIVSNRSRETHLPLVFVHPVEFLVTGARGQILQRALTGDSLWIAPDEIGTERDSSGIFYVDLPVD